MGHANALRVADERLRGYVEIASGIVLASSSAVFIRHINLPATVIVAGQALIVLPLMLSVLVIRRDRSVFRLRSGSTPFPISRPLTTVVAMGVLAALDHICFTLGVQKTQVANIVVLVYLYPVFTALLSCRILGEPLRAPVLLALACGMGGTLLVLSSSLADFDRRNKLATLLGIAVALAVAVKRVLAKKLPSDVSTMTVITAITLIVTMFFLPSLVVSRYSLTWSSAGVLVASALLTGVVSSWLILSGVRKLEANRAAVMSYIEPLAAVLLAWVFLAESPGPLVIAGGILIGCSAYLVLRSGFLEIDLPSEHVRSTTPYRVDGDRSEVTL